MYGSTQYSYHIGRVIGLRGRRVREGRSGYALKSDSLNLQRGGSLNIIEKPKKILEKRYGYFLEH